ncbi:MAG: hypothetical protein UT24_C0016G0035 [Candidatus Woesebacteria bacterium GW2011_GWB1_39_12]|uniref:Uncharacterized protein n=1 Tax=Candidatus Woesebacteria bacterium GW2011_GWB1_39_12 TaxID=1618574 RepID=A0A0G0MIH7_9BACT|nr:MAG: hypothetical protein UT24_C0016G0035 [Candidatus Woesebacteria bacterium GW2011_GWB1_39_12]
MATNLDYQKDAFKKLTSDIDKYKYLEKLRNVLRDIQKLSWRITQFDKKFSLENTDKQHYEELLDAYLEFGLEIDDLALWVREDEMRKNNL